MSSPTIILDRSTQLQQKITFLSTYNINNLYKQLMLTGLFLFLFYNLLSNGHLDQPPQYLATLTKTLYTNNHQTNVAYDNSNPTNISDHIVFAIASTVDLWKFRRSYIESWWQPNVTKGYVYLDREPTKFLPWPKSAPPYRVSENTALRYKAYNNKHPPTKNMIHRVVRVIVETFRETIDEGIRWFVMADDDTIFFLDNLLEMLQKYDHRKYYYIGESSECVLSNFDHSFEMAFGGAGYAISYPLAEALAKNMDVCIQRYPSVYQSDHLMQSCIADLGVSLTHEKGFHQIDLHSDISGFLSSHPQTPILSLHHLDMVDPLFPRMNRLESLNHLQKAAKEDQSRLLQQTICYDHTKNWSFSIAWGYTVQIYEKIIPPSVLRKPLETFIAWRKPSKQSFMFNTRLLSKNPCDMPHVFYLQSVEISIENNEIVTMYTRRTTRKLPPCLSSPNRKIPSSLPSDIATIIVVSPTTKYYGQVESTRRECCDVLEQVEKNATRIKYRACMKNEISGIY